MDMWGAFEFICIGISLMSLSLSIPSLHYFIAKKNASLLRRENNPSFRPKITLLLPMRNESTNVVRKVSEAFSFEYPEEKLKIIVVDSGSEDGTASLARELLDDRGQVISLDRPGKSFAINSFLDIVDTDFFVMMDADAICPPDSLIKLVDWFTDPGIGAVCGQQFDEFSEQDPYRKRFNILRVGESAIDSTPIFEGSICCFRVAAIGEKRINPNINADDSQLAMLVRSSGLRSIMDPTINFSEEKPISRQRRIRRSQGLSRALLTRRDLIFGNGRYGAFVFASIFFYVLMPWLLLSSTALLIIGALIGFEQKYDSQFSLEIFALFLPSLFLISSNFARSFISGLGILIESHLRMFFGSNLAVWNPER